MPDNMAGKSFRSQGFEKIGSGELLNYNLLGKSKVYLTYHAKERMAERGVLRQEVFDTIATPDETGIPTPQGIRVRHHRNSTVSVDVVYEIKGPVVRVITVIVLHEKSAFRTARLEKRKSNRKKKP